ncbi:MAG: hypothetical protein ACREOH_21265 [Candidatus Entotheonellia bacterium]
MRYRLKLLLPGRGLALYGLTALARVSPTLLSAIERWNYRPTMGVRERIAAALGVTAPDIWLPEREEARAPIP